MDHLYHQIYYKLVGIDLSRQMNRSILQQSNFTRKLEDDYGATMSLIAEKQQIRILNFSLYSWIVTEYKKKNIKKILHLLNEANKSKFVTRKLYIVNDH